jgi:uncharacterized protein (TIGR03437 family)
MDAHTTLKKTVLLLAFVLLILTPGSASAAQSISTCGSVTFSGLGANCTVSSTGADIPFTTGITYGQPTDPAWLSVNPASGTATSAGITLQLLLATTSLLNPNIDHTATVTLTPTAAAPAGSTGGSISVTFHPTTGTGGGSTTVVSDTGSMTFCATSLCSTFNYFNLSTGSVNPVPISISAPSFLTVTQLTGAAGSVSNSTPAQFSVQVNNFSTATTPSAITITYAGGSTSIAVNITSAGGGTGNISVNPSTVTWSYATGGQVPNSQGISFTDNNGAVSWSVNIATAAGDPSWLNIGYNSVNWGTQLLGVAFNGNPNAAFSLIPASNVFGSLSSGTHTATATISDTNNNTAIITVTLTVNGVNTQNGLTVNPGTVTLPSVAAGSTSQVSTSTTVTSTTSGNLTYSLSGTCPGISATFSNNGVLTANTSGVTLTVFGSPSLVQACTYNACTLTVNLLNGFSSIIASVNVPVTWVVGTGSSGGGGASNPVLPIALTFVSEVGMTTPSQSQQVAVTASGTWTATVTYNTSQTNWITSPVSNATGSGPGNATIAVNSTGLAAGTYTGKVTFTVVSSLGTLTQDVTITLNVYSTAAVFANPGSLILQGNNGSIAGSTQFQVLATDSTSIPFTISTTTPWLTLLSGTSLSTPAFPSFQVNLSNLANGVYTGSFTISAPNAANGSLTVPVVLTVTGSTATGGNLTFSTSSLAFNSVVNGTAPAAVSFTATAPAGVSYTVSANGTANGVNWLSISPSGFISSSSQNITVSVTPGALTAGTYSGSISFATGTTTQTVPVTLTVSGSTNTSTVVSNPTSLTFNANQNGTAPASQTLSITSPAGSASVGFNLSTTQQNGATTWLTVSTSGNTTPATVTVNASPSGLVPGTYTGAVVLTPVGGNPVSVTVTLVVTGLTVSASPTTLNLAYSAGGTPPTATINLSGSAGNAGLNYTATVTSSCNCIAISPPSGNTATNPGITVTLTNPTNLTAGTYTGTITVNGTNGATGTTAINVTLTVTAPLPTISAIVNAASGAAGAVSPGELVSIFGTPTNPIGPVTPVQLSASNLTSTGNVPTTMGGVTVTFNGRPAPLIYVSATQINAVVPYGVAGFSNFPVIVSYLGQTSNGFNVQATTTAPGIFTQNGQGSGPGAILNGDGSVNGIATANTKPATRGSVVSVYMTGEGATSPTGVDGKVTCGITGTGCSSLSQIPVPLLPVAVLVDGQPAALATAPGWVGYGEAPGLVSGVLQVSVIIPNGARSGSVPMVISVGGNTSQANVTVTVQ